MIDCLKKYFVFVDVNCNLFLVNEIFIFLLFFDKKVFIDFKFVFLLNCLYFFLISEGILIENFMLEFGLILCFVFLNFL